MFDRVGRARHLFHIQVTRDVVFFIVSHQHFPQEASSTFIFSLRLQRFHMYQLAYRGLDDLKGLFFQKVR
jgi:hypothetical protein